MSSKVKARTWIQNLPDNPLYKEGHVVYPPRGLNDIAELCAEFHDSCQPMQEELLSEIMNVLALRMREHIKYIQTSDQPPNGYAAVLIPDWQVKQWIEKYQL